MSDLDGNPDDRFSATKLIWLAQYSASLKTKEFVAKLTVTFTSSVIKVGIC